MKGRVLIRALLPAQSGGRAWMWLTELVPAANVPAIRAELRSQGATEFSIYDEGDLDRAAPEVREAWNRAAGVSRRRETHQQLDMFGGAAPPRRYHP